MPTIAVANQTREVAKTTTTLSLEAALQEIDKRVLVVDRDHVSWLNLESTLAGLLETVRGQYDYILIDCHNSPRAAAKALDEPEALDEPAGAADRIVLKLLDQQAITSPFDFETFALDGPQRWLGVSA
jgi:hypothetical protein